MKIYSNSNPNNSGNRELPSGTCYSKKSFKTALKETVDGYSPPSEGRPSITSSKKGMEVSSLEPLMKTGTY